MSDRAALFGVLDILVRVRCNDQWLDRRINELFDGCSVRAAVENRVDLEVEVRCDDASQTFEVRANGEVGWSGTDREQVLEWCAWLVNDHATSAPKRLVLHGAAAALGDSAVVITGPSGAGKSTLVSALVLAGMAYMGDDSVAIDEGGARIRSNPKPISVDEPAKAVLARLRPGNAEVRRPGQLLAPGAVGRVLRHGCDAAPILILRPCYRPDTPTAMKPLHPANAAALLADQSFNFAARGREALHVVGTMARACAAFIFEFSDLSEAVDLVIGAMRTGLHVEPDEPVSLLDDRSNIEICGGEALIWDENSQELHHLSRTATAVWMSYERSASPERIAADVTGTVLVDPVVVEDVRRCIRELRTLGLLPVRPHR